MFFKMNEKLFERREKSENAIKKGSFVIQISRKKICANLFYGG